MFDSTPLKRNGSRDYNGMSHETALARAADRRRSLRNRPAPSGEDRVFDILAVWDEDVVALREQVDVVSSWGPYEPFECIPLFEGRDGRRRVLCRFVYHGSTSDHLTPDSRAQFKYALLNCLRQITDWEDVAGHSHVGAEPE